MSLSTEKTPAIDFYTQLRPKGLRVSLNPNAVELDVTAGDEGCMLTMRAMGVHMRIALNREAKAHLIKLLTANAECAHQKTV